MRRKNTKRFDPRYFMAEKTDVLEEAHEKLHESYGDIQYPHDIEDRGTGPVATPVDRGAPPRPRPGDEAGPTIGYSHRGLAPGGAAMIDALNAQLDELSSDPDNARAAKDIVEKWLDTLA